MARGRAPWQVRQRPAPDRRQSTTFSWRGSTTARSKGDDKDLPPPLKFVEGWKIGEPDKVFAMAEEFKVAATGVLDYKRFVVDPGFKDDVWVQAAECRPGNREVVHHILVYILAPGRRDPYERGRHGGHAGRLGAGRYAGQLLARTRPGKFRPARSCSSKSTTRPNGTEHTDRSSVGIRLAKSRPRTPSR